MLFPERILMQIYIICMRVETRFDILHMSERGGGAEPWRELIDDLFNEAKLYGSLLHLTARLF